ncbi:MAG: glycoside hydrolase family protein [Pseudomonadota bacterium]|uniref:lysozyme n=1 Tax=Phenylobacterium sp. TaxID=1871053 RepID=UPI0025EAA78D|nr:glycoside hydrolase family protein [Phenylobacterium sp.]MBT9472256.1 glycoside hydrolase family protein [Phenylobacterium sp.]
MKPRYQVSRSAIELIKRFEGYRRKSARLADGRWTIGYGHTLTAREGADVSEQDAEALLIYDLIAVAHSVNEWVYTPLTQNQFDALTAFAFNIGLDNFRGSSVLRRLNEGALIQAACAMELWRKAEFEGERIVVDALVRRRSAEKTLFLTPTNGWVPAPSPLLQPNLDLDTTGVVPRQTPTALTAPMDGPVARVERDEANQETPTQAVEDDSPSPTTLAAATLTSRLSTIFSADDVANIRSVAEAAAPGPRLVIEEIATSSLAPFPHALASEAEHAFNLTQPEEDLAPPAAKPPKLELVAANESEPSLFDDPILEEVVAEIEPEPAEPLAELELEPAAQVSAPLAAAYEPTFDATQPAKKSKPAFLPALGLATAGVGLFGGCLFWAINVPSPAGGGVLNPGTVVWLAGIAGVGLIGVAVYMILDRLGRSDIEPTDENLERDE